VKKVEENRAHLQTMKQSIYRYTKDRKKVLKMKCMSQGEKQGSRKPPRETGSSPRAEERQVVTFQRGATYEKK